MTPPRLSMHTRTSVVLFALLVSAGGAGSQAHAQAWLPDRAYTEGPGIRAGDLEIHPGVAVRGGYDTNVFRADGDVQVADDGRVLTQEEQGSAILAVTPHVHLSTLSEQRLQEGGDRQGETRALPPLAFRGGVSATYFHYFLDEAPKNLEVDSDLWLGILPQRPFNIDLNFVYERHIRPFSQYAGSRNAYDYHYIQPRVRFNMGSRSQVLTSYIGYVPRFTLYESSLFDYLDNLEHGVEAGAAWKFLPNTALVYDGNLGLQDFRDDNGALTNSPVVFANNKLFRTRLGINGAITKRLSARILAGYGMIVLDDDGDGRLLDDHEDVVGEAVLAWRFGSALASQLELGYRRDLQTSAMGGWTRLDRGFITMRALLGRVFLLSLEGSAAYVGYGAMVGYDRRNGAQVAPLGIDGTDREDIRIDGAVRGEYRVTNWLSLMADVSVQTVITDFDYALYFGNQPLPDSADYTAILAFGGVRLHY